MVLDMDIDEFTQWCNRLLKNFKEGVIKLERNSYDRGAYFDYYNPLIVRSIISWKIRYLDTIGFDTSKLKNDFLMIDNEFNRYKKNNEEKYYDHIYNDFKALLAKYDPKIVPGSGYEFEYLLNRRTDIEILSNELKDRYDIKDYKDLIKELDKALIDNIKESIKEKVYSPIDDHCAPKEYWWLHLEDVYGKPEEIID
jgi:hypothetical protein